MMQMMFTTDSSVSSLLGSTLRRARGQMSTRKLAALASVSQAQISRIENGLVLKPSREILIALARTLDRNPVPLLILAGHLKGRESQQALGYFFGPEKEVPLEWGPWASRPLDVVRASLSGGPQDEVLTDIAADIFLLDVPEMDWDDIHNLTAARGEQGERFRLLMEIWAAVGDRGRDQLLEYGRTLKQLSDLEWTAELELAQHVADTQRDVAEG